MSEILEFFRQPDTTDFVMDPYGRRVILQVDIQPVYREDSEFLVRGTLTRDGQPYPGIPWPRDDGDLDTVAIGVNQAIMGIQVEKDHCGSPFHWELEMRPDGQGGFVGTNDKLTRIPGMYVYKVVAQGIFEQPSAPAGKITALFRAKTGSFQVQSGDQPISQTGIWIAGSLGSAGVSPNLRHRFRLRRFADPTTATAVTGEFVLPMIPRIPNANIGNGGLVVDNRRLALDALTGDLYASGYQGPTSGGIIERFRSEGARSILTIDGLGDAEVTCIALNPRSRTLWLGYPTHLTIVDLSSLQITRRIENQPVAVLHADLAGSGVWAMASRGSPQRQWRLLKFETDGSVASEAAALDPLASPGWMAPLASGGAVVFGRHNRVPQLVAVDADGQIVHSSGQLAFSLVDLAANTATGEVWAIVADNRRRGLLQKFKPDLSPEGVAIDPNGRYGSIQSLISVAVEEEAQRTWLAGLQFNPNPPPGTPPGPIGHLGIGGEDGSFTPAVGGDQAISLLRSFG